MEGFYKPENSTTGEDMESMCRINLADLSDGRFHTLYQRYA
jgi:hypothetical protein